jgi:hypothetical protein
MRRISTPMIAITAVSAAAFVLLPQAGASAGLLLCLTVIWAVTSSALRAPPMAMFAKYVSAAAAPRFVFLSLLGIGIASSIAPWLTGRLRGMSPTLPFVLAGVGLVAAVLAMGWCERRLMGAKESSAATAIPAAAAAAAPPRVPVAALFVAVLLLGLGFQVHAFINSAPAYLRFAKAPDLEWLMGLYWVGFSVFIMAPGVGVFARARPALMLILGTTCGALAFAALPVAASLPTLIGAQLCAGAAWGLITGYALTAALDAGRTGREGRFTGLIFALLAAAALTRFLIVLSGLHTASEFKPLLAWLPAVAWAGALVLLIAAARSNTFSR